MTEHLTPEQTVSKLRDLLADYGCIGVAVEEVLDASIRSAVQAERERCARIADDVAAKAGIFTTDCEGTAHKIAAAIRSFDTTKIRNEEDYGCHCDLESMGEGFEPDGCVIDEGAPQDCIYSKCDDKWKCEYWKLKAVRSPDTQEAANG